MPLRLSPQRPRSWSLSTPGLPIDKVQWDLCHLPMRTSSVDIIITDMPLGKRMGSRKKNWDLYPPCVREMAQVSRPGSGKAVILTQDKKCFQKAMYHTYRLEDSGGSTTLPGSM
ncbi:tRNA (guanine(6)-N2)-methyltransferase THUMP3-like [Oncorhynchus nerka]|uniref:tRNA (guanine(6)-N2)-methyltransferase THUMP3-like n=1 Tax=Oncorhynchus nerka TaxID=8023 RepID=UPI0031B8A8CE